MADSVARYLNALAEARATAELTKCCASSRWADAMIAARPFASDAELFDAAERSWWALDRADWLEAFGAHPCIGDGAAAGPGHAATREWSGQEQARAATAPLEVRAALAAGNAEYERRFGHVFLICAMGRPADEILVELRRRLENDPAAEIREAAGEQAKITRLRLARLAAP
jgi:2-oxo-4-hydroxy-4-carboxy-5-ureidoimidazoline decarboxylase